MRRVAGWVAFGAITIAVVVFAYFWFVIGPQTDYSEVFFWFVFLVIPVLGVVGIGSFMYWITGFVNLSTNDQKTPART